MPGHVPGIHVFTVYQQARCGRPWALIGEHPVRRRARAAGSAVAPVVGVHFLKETAAFVLGEEALLLAARDGEPERVAVHGGGDPVVGERRCPRRHRRRRRQGRLDRRKRDNETLATDAKRRWIDHVAVGPGGAVAWSAGKQAFARTGKGAEKSLEVVSTVGALAFAPKGFRLAVAHYNGATLWFPNAKAEPDTAGMEGLASRRAVSARRPLPGDLDAGADAARLAARRHEGHAHVGLCARACARSTGPPTASGSRPRARPSSCCGRSPARTAPWASSRSCARRPSSRLDVVACHPKQGVVAAGFADGLMLLVRTDDGAEILAQEAGRRAGHGAGLERERQAARLRHRERRGRRASI